VAQGLAGATPVGHPKVSSGTGQESVPPVWGTGKGRCESGVPDQINLYLYLYRYKLIGMKLNRLTPDQRSEIVRRRQSGESLNTIMATLGVPKGVVAYHIRKLQRPILLPTDRAERMRAGAIKAGAIRAAAARDRMQERFASASALWKRFGCGFEGLSSSRKGLVGEAAVLLRLLLLGYEVYSPVLDGPSDWVIVSGRRLIRLQVKMAGTHRGGSKFFLNQRRRGTALYHSNELDFFVAYSLMDDVCYVVPSNLAKGRFVALRSEMRENWDLLQK